MSYEELVERWQKVQLNDHLLGIYGLEVEDEEFDEIDHWAEPEDEEIER